MPAQRTTIIISDLSRAECITIPAIIKSEVQLLQKELGEPDLVDQWSELPFLSRLVVSIKDESLAEKVFRRLKQSHPDLKVHLSESIRRRNKSFDLTLTAPTSPILNRYEEPEPAKSTTDNDMISFPSPKLTRKRTLVEGLKLDTSVVKNKDGTISPMSPTITLEQVDQT
jgi:hypothetical protein